jgi:predicted esterase
MAWTERSIETPTHGRYLLDSPGPGMPLLAGFHGYAETAETEMGRLRSLEACERWSVVAVQALHRFYRGRSTDVVASWMTRQDRELAIADNTVYTTRVIDAVAAECSPNGVLVFSGFSQGVAMALRCATSIARPVSGVVALGGDIPPELDASALRRVPAVLLGRGVRDEWYTPEKMASDEQRLRAAGTQVQKITFEGAHEWTPAFAQEVSRFCRELDL